MSAPTTYTGQERILDWEGALNARDTGGLLVAGGGHIRPGALVRSDVLTRLTPSGRAALIAHGVRTIIDVRTSDEIERDVDYPFRDDPDADPRYVNVSFVTELDEARAAEVHALRHSATRLEELNKMDLEVHRAGVAAVISAVADAQPGGVLVHCYAGKDRTGLSVALLLSVAGVSDEDIADDYALTMLNLEPLIAEWLQTIPDEAERDRMRILAAPSREAMLETLGYVAEHYSDASGYLRSVGVSEAQLQRIRERLIKQPSGTAANG